MFDLVMYEGGKERESVRCEVTSCFIGSAADCLLRLPGWRIPKYLGEVTASRSGLIFHPKGHDDLKFAGAVIKQPTVVPSGSRLEFRQLHIEFRYNDALLKRRMSVENTDSRTAWVTRLHSELLREMDLRRTDLSSLDDDEVRDRVTGLLPELLARHQDALPDEIEPQVLMQDVVNEAVGLGPLEALLSDPEITEIMVNRYDDIYIERGGRLQKSEVCFSNDAAVRAAIERIVSPLGRRIDESSPLVDARLKDGSRVNAVIPPLALRGSCITIRKFAEKKLTESDLIGFGAASAQMMAFLRVCVENRLNIVISGGTGSGKTTLLNVLSNYIPSDERVVTVEDAAELKLAQPHLVSLEARPANIEGKGQISIRDLVKNCLRMRPDRIVVGECRGGEALDMLQAMNTGHDGSLTTAHANSPRDALTRLEVMVLMAGMDLPVAAIRQQVSSAVDLIVQQSRLPDGSRKITAICEVLESSDGHIQVAPVFEYKRSGLHEDGSMRGKFVHTGHRPAFIQQLADDGFPVDVAQFGWSP